MSRLFAMLTAVAMAMAITMPCNAQTETGSRYQQLLKSPGHMQTIRTVGLSIMALPDEFDTLYPQFAVVWWAAQDDLEMDPEMRKIEMGKLRSQMKNVSAVVKRNHIKKLSFIGFTEVGIADCLDLYFTAVTPRGPVIFSVSIATDGNKMHRLHEFRVYEHWDQARFANAAIQERAGKGILSVTYVPAAEKTSEDGEPVKKSQNNDDETIEVVQ